MEKSDYVAIFITTGSADEARQVAKALLEQRKVACVNIVPKADSLFWWEGEVDSARENLLIAKTKASLLLEVIKLVKETHSYDIPEIIALPIIGGNQDYLDWIEKSVA